jgi:hypothetical protein
MQQALFVEKNLCPAQPSTYFEKSAFVVYKGALAKRTLEYVQCYLLKIGAGLTLRWLGCIMVCSFLCGGTKEQVTMLSVGSLWLRATKKNQVELLGGQETG